MTLIPWMIKASDEEASRRLEICKACPEMKMTPLGELCGVCKCVMRIKTKLKITTCPKEKW